MSLLKKALHEHRFVCVVEFVPKPAVEHFAAFEKLMRHETLCDWPMVAAIADRVGGASDITPLDAAGKLDKPVPTLIHFSGKDREREALLADLARMDAMGLDQFLLLSGDRLPGHDPGQEPIRYLESVSALQIVRQARPNWLLGAALNPFKYCEEEGGAQYFKAEKKLAAGADFLTLQLGFDAVKYLEVREWGQRQSRAVPVIACVIGLTRNRAAMLEHVPGVVISASMRAILASEEGISKAYAKARSTDRLALQIIGLKLMGYARIHLSGIHNVEQLEELERAIEKQQTQVQTLERWFAAWEASWQIEGLPVVNFNPEGASWRMGESQVNASAKERLRYHLLSGLHSLVFNRSSYASRGFGWAVQRRIWTTPSGARLLCKVERSLKSPLVGCDTCGSCRLEDTLYICPETCPKGVANGPCGGTRLNRCEFGDRECIHSAKYRIAKSLGQTAVLTERLIPSVDIISRHQSSWPRWFNADGSSAAAGLSPQQTDSNELV
ncbi:methylenetetrahydrofolate reductase C-terminal domain-containing protein [Pseudomonas sp. Marseille-Q0931]|uniref:methylenetetrahydrofolate reductase C-terminal domain-containing protein n=1 Tax=Pseudomonas sp. Marseille-Q0931 TaxID=2697507 RepID=UPI0023B9B3BA|nr:methylenetetrahydrofolate reductase C-terminal domain-containing protein [Pseudomonas sp. Marseille-Q0931]